MARVRAQALTRQTPVGLSSKLVLAEALLPLRTRFRQEMNCQIVHDSIHRREGWTRSYLLEQSATIAGFGSVAVDGPWKGKPTVFEFIFCRNTGCARLSFLKSF